MPDVLSNLPAPQTDDALRKTAASQIDLEIGQSVAPIQSQIDTAQAREDRSLGQIGGMFDALQPVVNQAAQGVQSAYDQASSQENAIYSAAQARLQQIRGQRASDAQSLAQKIGGPVAIDEWTTPYDQASTDLTYLGAGAELHTLAYAQAGTQQAQQFAGQIFPLVRTEQMASVRNQFEDQIREYQDQITALKSQRGAQVNKRFNDLRTQELQYGMQRAQLQLDQIDKQRSYNLEVKKAKTEKAAADRQYRLDKQQFGLDKTKMNHDYEIALRTATDTEQKNKWDYSIAKDTVAQEDKRIKIAQDQLDLSIAQTFGKDKRGRETLDAIKEDNRVKEQAKAYGLSEKELKLKQAELAHNRKISEAKLASMQKTEWADLLEGAVHPQAGKNITTTSKVNATAAEAFSGDSSVFYDPTSPTGYSKLVTQTNTQSPLEPIHDPTRLVDYLVSAVGDTKTMPKSRAIELVKSRFAGILPDNWKYGDKWPPVKSNVDPTSKKAAAAAIQSGLYMPNWLKVTDGGNDSADSSGVTADSSSANDTGSTAGSSVPNQWPGSKKDPIVGPGPPGTGLHKTRSGKYVNSAGFYQKL